MAALLTCAWPLRLLGNRVVVFSLAMISLAGISATEASAQNILWAQSVGGTGNDQVARHVVDGSGNIYLTGAFQSAAVNFGNHALTNAATNMQGGALFVAKYNQSGEALWAATCGTTGTSQGTGIAIDGQGNAYVVGRFSGGVTFGSNQFLADGGFLTKFNPNGEIIWAKCIGPLVFDDQVAVDAVGNAYVLGQSIIKYDPEGNVLFDAMTNSIRFSPGAVPSAFAVDSLGQAIVGGYLSGAVSLGDLVIGSPGSAGFLLKLDAQGHLSWISLVGGTAASSDEISSVTVDFEDNVFVVGAFSSPTITLGTTVLVNASGQHDAFIAKYDSHGEVLWAKRAGSVRDEYGNQIAVNRSGDVLICGAYEGSAVFGSIVLDYRQDFGIFLAKYTSDGELSWAKGLGERGGILFPIGIALDSVGETYLTSNFYSPSIGIGSSNFTSQGSGDVILVKLSGGPPAPYVLVNGVTGQVFDFTNRTSVGVYLQEWAPRETVFYTTDGSTPDFTSALFTGGFDVSTSTTVRVIAYDSEFNSTEAGPVRISFWFSLTTDASRGGTVTLDSVDGVYPSGATAHAIAVPDAGWQFLNWTNDAGGTNPVLNVTMDRRRSIRAVFGTPINTVVNGDGAIQLNPQRRAYPYGATVQVFAVSQPGNLFALWGGVGLGNVNPFVLTIDRTRPTISALFSGLPAGRSALTVLANGNGAVSVSPRANFYTNGETVTIAATPADDQRFYYWSGDTIEQGNPLTVVMDRSKVITANFSGGDFPILLTCTPRALQSSLLLSLTGEPLHTYWIEQSENFSTWASVTALDVLAQGRGTGVVALPFSPTNSQRFYRARLNGP
jgi:hypothetical protein